MRNHSTQPDPQDPAMDSVAGLARSLAGRLDWEWECGALGFSKQAATKSLEGLSSARTLPVSLPPVPTPAPVEASPSSPLQRPDVGLSPSLDDLRKSIGDCRLCALCEERTQLVFGEGNPRADLVFVGEGPGRDEDLTGRPFVGQAGQLLDKIIAAMGLRRDDVYICNIVKCRPPQNRVPLPAERSACRGFLEAQLRLIAPRIVVSLGATATATLLGREEPLSRVRGSFFDLGLIRVMPTYHPAYLLRNPGEKRAVWEDMQKVMAALGLALPVRTEAGGS